jgi:calcineurin-like phosphoesterase
VTVAVIADTDGDGLIDSDETNIHGTDPALADTDSDGFFDGHEILVGTNAIDGINVFPPTTVISAGNSNNVISTDTTWTLAQSPFWLQSDVSIQSGATLTIEPGVVVKSDVNVDILVNNGGALVAVGNAAIPQHVVFTSALDDSINGDTNGNGGANQPSDNDWNGIDFQSGSINGLIRNAAVKYGVDCIDIANSSPVIDSVELGDCGSIGIDIGITSSATHGVNLSNITVNDYDGNGISTLNDGFQITSTSGATANLNIRNVTISDIGNSASNDFGIRILASGGNINGTIDNVSVINPSSDGINIVNSFTGDANIALSNLSVTGSGANSLDVRDTSTASGQLNLTFDGVNSFSSQSTTTTAMYFENNDPDFLATPGSSTSVDSAGYGLQLNNSAGSFRNITMNNTVIAGMRLENASNPLVFSNIVLTNADTPYELVGQNLTPTITAGYDFSAPSVLKNYIRVLGSFPADMTLTPDPLNTGGTGLASVWRVPGDITVPAGVTLTIDDGAIVKFDLSRIVFVNGSLVIGDGVAGGVQSILTSTRDESIGADADPADNTAPAAGNWNYLQLNNGSTINIDNAIVRYMNRGIFQSFSDIAGFTITNSEFREFNTYGMDIITTGNDTYILNTVTVANLNPSTNNSDGIRIANSGTRTITVDFDNVTVDTVGNDTNNDRGIEFFLDNDSLLTGRLDNITVSNTFGTGIILQNSTAGLVNPVFSGLNITSPGLHGLQIIGNSDGFTRPTLDASTSINLIGNSNPGSGGFYGMLVQGVDGSFSNITISNTTSSALFLSGTNNPTWNDATIVLNSSPAPWTIRTDFPASIGVLGTADVGYTAGTGLVQNYIQVNSTLVDTTLVADPLNTGGAGPASVWRVDTDITIPAGVTLTINDGAIVKFDLNRFVFVNGNLVIGDGQPGGAQSILTSTRDETVGADADPADNSAPAAGNWNYLQLNNGSSINIDNAIVRYMNRGIFQSFSDINSFSISNSEFREFSTYGMDITTTGNDTYALNIVTVANQNPSTNNSDGIRIANSGTRTITLDFDNVTVDTVGNDITNDRGIELFLDNNSLLTGRLDNTTVSNTFGTGILLQNTTAGLVNPVFSGLNITNPGSGRYGLRLIGNSDGFTQPTVDDSFSPGAVTNFIGDPLVADSGGVYGLLLQGVDGIYNNITISNTVSSTPVNDPKASALFISGVSNPTVWDDTSIILNNSASPWTIRTSFPASIGVLGTADLGYTAGTGLIQNYVQVNSTISDMSLVPDPLNTASAGPPAVPASVWRVDTDVTIPTGATLTIDDGAIVKFDLSRIVVVNGNLVIGDGDGLGAPAILTSTRDETVGADADPADNTAPVAGNWNYLQLNNGSSINIDNAIVRYMSRGILQSFTDVATFSISNSEFREFSVYGMDITTTGNDTYTLNTVTVANQNPSTNNNDGIRIVNSGTRTITIDFDNVTVDTVGNDVNNDRGIEFFLNANSLLTGRLDNITVSNTFGTGIILQNSSAGLVNPVFSGLDISNPGLHGIQLIGLGAGNTTPTIDGSTASNIIGSALTAGSGGDLGLTFQGVNGSYSDITINSTNDSALYFSDNANPVFGLNITLDNSPSPYSLVGMALPAGVVFTPGGSLVQDYVRLFSDLIGDLTLTADPLGAGTYYRVVGNLNVTSGNTLTIGPGTLMKFDQFQLSVESGGTLNINGVSGNEVIMTSFTDATDGTGAVSTGNTLLIIDWEGILFNQGSLGGTINFLTLWYARDGVEIVNSGAGLSLNNLTVNYAQDGIRLNATAVPVSPAFNNLSINECSSVHLHLLGGGTMSPTFSGSLEITDINGTNATYGLRIDSDDNTRLSGFTITGSTYALYLQSTSAIVENSILRQAGTNGARILNGGAPIVQNNIIVNNGNGGGDHGGIYTTSTGAFINNNVIRHNRGAWGVGIYVDTGGSPVIQNNLIIENFDVVADVWGGSGILVFSNASPTIINNTIADNTSVTISSNAGAGLAFQSYTGTATVTDNILFGNVDGNSNANNFYVQATTGTVNENFNLVGAGPGAHNVGAADTHNLGISLGVNDIVDDPDFTDGWYLSSLAAVPPQLVESPARDAGSVLAGNTANGAGVVVLTATTTRTDGVNEGAGSTVDLGYHYPNGSVAPTVNAGLSTVSPATFNEAGNAGGTVVTITVTPRDGGNVVVGAGLAVVATTLVDQTNLSTVIDLGDGSYEVTYTIPAGTGGDTVSFTANGQAITANTVLTWSP